MNHLRGLLALAAAAGLLTSGMGAAMSPASAAAAGQSRVTTVGRFETAGNYLEYTWPGIYFEGRFRGTGVGIVLDDPVNDYDRDAAGGDRRHRDPEPGTPRSVPQGLGHDHAAGRQAVRRGPAAFCSPSSISK